MGLLGTTTQQSYYSQSQSFTGTGSQQDFVLLTASFPTLPAAKTSIQIFVNNVEINTANYNYPNMFRSCLKGRGHSVLN